MEDADPPSLELWLREWPHLVEILASPLRPVRAEVPAETGSKEPVLVFPGILSSDRATSLLRRTLRARGYCAHASGLGLVTGVTPRIVAAAERRLFEVHAAEQRKVVLMGWSLGGLFARVLAQRHPELVRLVMTMGTPFSGDRRANNAWRLYEAINDHKVDAPPVPDDPSVKPPVPTVALWSPNDGVVAPASARGQAHETDAAIEVPFRHFALGANRAAIARMIEELDAALGGEAGGRQTSPVST